MRWARYVARMRVGGEHTGFWRTELRESDHLEDLGVDGRIILRRSRYRMGWNRLD